MESCPVGDHGSIMLLSQQNPEGGETGPGVASGKLYSLLVPCILERFFCLVTTEYME